MSIRDNTPQRSDHWVDVFLCAIFIVPGLIALLVGYLSR